MQVIPVIDLLSGEVVLAKQGQRDQYAPIKSPLTPSSKLYDVIRAYLTIYPFNCFYVADLDAIVHHQPNHAQIEKLLRAFPKLRFMIDSGYQLLPGFYQNFANYLPILGTEAFASFSLVQWQTVDKNFVLSLDFMDEQLLGPHEFLLHTEIWPKQIILMNLRQVGSHQGPDFVKLTSMQQQFPQHDFIAAGGVRCLQDLSELSRIGIRQALIASALHHQTLTRADLESLNCPA